jgi:hypothetical protein
MSKFNLNKSIERIINIALDDLYKNLNSEDLNILKNYTKRIIEIIGYQYNLNPDSYYAQLEINDYKDIKWLSTLLLPFSNISLSEIESFKKMFIEKIEDVDINKEEPKYKFTNIQYSRCDNILEFNKIISKERDFDIRYLETNYKLLVKTILQSSYKLYINWINIRPISVSHYDNTSVYKNTNEIILNKKIKNIDENLDKYSFGNITDYDAKYLSSIHIRDIYNVLRNYYYEEIKIIKLLIFDLYSPSEKVLYPSIYVLRDLFSESDYNLLNDALNNKLWIELSDEHHNIFIEKWNNLVNGYVTKNNIKISNYDISSISIQNLVKAIMINFDFRYGYRRKVKESGYIQMKSNKDINLDSENDVVDEENISEFRIYNSKECIKSINGEFIYDFFRDILQQFKKTVYTLLLTDNKKDINKTTFYEGVTYKNLYNFAKSISHKTTNGKYILLDKHWESLSINDKNMIIEKLNRKYDFKSWFNITKILRSQQLMGFIQKGKKNIQERNREIFDEIINNIAKNIFFALIGKGILSTYIPFPINKNRLENEKIQDIINQNVFSNNLYLEESYYYLTELPYSDSGNYAQYILDTNWYSMDPMEFPSQIGFIHHFLNNRVSFLSGATGVGKSTHVPKLFLYYLKALDYKSSGNVVCTQPRKTPTEGAARFVSKQLGLPVFNEKSKDDTGDDLEITTPFTEYRHVQMKHKDRNNVTNIYGLILKFITDGSLVSEFRDILPYFKMMSYDKKTITNKNLYDIIIIDESHEHNKNMDILLTLMRTYIYYNPSIRLVILSATLDDDEPTYRRYYRCINDNLKYPFDDLIKKYDLDRINIDRRYHISPPESGTRFSVVEHYKPEYNNKEGLVTLLKGLIKENKGDILVFQPGEADIKKLIELINSDTSIESNWIALPFYSSLNDDKKGFIEKIDDTLPTLRIDRESDFNEVPSLIEGNKSYTNFILIATNIAEASITINRLYYVVDTGTRKSNIYDFKKRSEKLKLAEISETSRIQRKGRVGRVKSGGAYFVYEKGKMSKNKIPFEFSITNIDIEIYNLMRKNNQENKFIINNKIYYDIIKSNYETIDGVFNYIGNKNDFDYEYKEYIPVYYESGYNIEDLKDKFGRFYIIHPDELLLDRNINGTIINIINNDGDVKILDKDSGKIESKKINSFFEDMTINKFIDEDFNKTEEGINISEIMEKFQLDNKKFTKILTYSILLGCFDKILLAISILESLNNDIMKFVKKDNLGLPILNKIKYYSQYTKSESDVEVMMNCILELLNQIDSKRTLNLESKINNDFTLDGKTVNYLNILESFKNNENYEDGIDRNDILINILSIINKELANNDSIKKICDIMEINPDIIINKKSYNTFIYNFIKLNDIKTQLYHVDKNGKSYKDFIEKYTQIYKDKYSEYDSFKLSFLLANPYNVCLNIDNTNSYLIINSPYADNTYSLGKSKIMKNNKKEYVLTTLMKDNNIRGYLIYNNIDSDKETISNLIKIDDEYLKIFKSIFNKLNTKKIVNMHQMKIDKYLIKLDKDREFKAPLSKDYDVISKYGKAYDRLLQALE